MGKYSLNKLNLTAKEKTLLGVQAAIQAIPYVGGSIATIYFGYKKEIRFKRLEAFYARFASEAEVFKDKIALIESHHKDKLIAIIEELNEKVEHETVKEKIDFLKNYFRSTLVNPITDSNFDERQYFLNVLGSMTLLESEILKFLLNKNNIPTQIIDIKINDIDQYAIIGGVEKLKSYGFLESQTISVMIGTGQDNRLKEKVNLSDFGKKFYEFCIG